MIKNITFYRKSWILMLVFSSLVFTTNAYGQCSLKGATQAGQQITHCIDNTNTVTTPNLNAGQYAVVNVVKGFSYTFSSDLYFGIYYTNLTLYNESNDTLLGFDRAWAWPSYPSITWTANFSGKVKVLLSKGQDCYNDGTSGGPITVKLNTIGNTQDAQDSFGTDQWIGHVFNWTGNSPGGTTSPTNPFTASNYVGYYNVSTETISEGFGGSDVCFPVLSAGVNRVNIYTDKFAVRYRMRSTKTGYYRLNIAGDDGVRVYVDNTLVINGWKDQGETAYCQLVYLKGNSDIVFDYYENGGGNVAKFNMSAANVLEGADKRFACSGISPGTLVGNEYTPCVASNSLYQWQSSSDNITFSDISGATSKDYQVPAITTLAINTRYFRRILKQTVANSTSPVVSNVITVITNPTPTLSGASQAAPVCAGAEAVVNLTGLIPKSVSTVAYMINNVVQPAATNVTADAAGQASFTTRSLTAADNNQYLQMISITSTNPSGNCTATFYQGFNLNIRSVFNAGSIQTQGQTICSGSVPTSNIGTANWVSGGDGSYTYQWQYSTDINFIDGVTTVSSNTATYTPNQTLTQTTYYRRQVKDSSCNTSFVSSAGLWTVVVSPALFITVAENSPVTQLATSVQLQYTGNNGTEYDIEFDAKAVAAGFVTAHGNVYGNSGFIQVNIPYCVATGVYNGKIRVIAQNPLCSSDYYDFKITVNPFTGPCVLSSDQVVCSGILPKDLTLSNNTEGVIKWQRSLDAAFTNPTDIPVSAATLPASTIGILAQDTYFRAIYKYGGCDKIISNAVLIKVVAGAVTPTVLTTAPDCSVSGSAKIENFVSGNTYVFSPSGPSVLATGLITNMIPGRNYTVTTNNGSCTSAASSSFKVESALPMPNLTLSSALGTDAQTVCNNSPVTSIVYSTAGATGVTVTDLPSGVTFVWNNSVLTISGTPLASGSYTVNLTGNCGTINKTGTITVTPANTVALTSALNTNNQQICAATAISPITYQTTGANGIDSSGISTGVNGLPAGISATWENNTITITGTPTVTGTFNYNIPLTGGCTGVFVSGKIVIGETSTFTNNAWDKGKPDNNGLNAVFNDNYNTGETGRGSVYACNCTVNSGKTLTIAANTTLTVINTLTNNGNLTVESDGNLVQVNDAAPANTGNITVLRDLKIKPKSAEYNYFGSPVTFAAGQSMKTIYPGITYVLYHNEANNYFYNSSGANVPGRGLAVKEPLFTADTSNGAYDITATFIGVPQNGIINFALANSNTATSSHLGYNLVGNPYPSNIDLQALYELNKGQIAADPAISTSFYFWDSTANNVYVQQGSSYGGQAYGVFNAKSGSKGMGIPAAGPKEGLTFRKIPQSEITVGQGFMVKALKKNATLQFNNSIRTDKNSGVKFIGARAEEVIDDRYWLSVTTPGNLTSTLAVVYFDGGTDALGAEDSEARGGSDEVFSHVSGKNIAINGKSTFADTDVVEIGTRHFAAGLHTIALEKAEGIFASGQQIYLKDKITGAVTNLSQGNYTFEAQAGESTGRFEVVYKPGGVLATDASAKEEVQVYRAADNFVVKAPKRITSLEIFDMSGRLVRAFKPNTPEAVVNGSELANGVYLMNIKQGQEQTVKKIVK